MSDKRVHVMVVAPHPGDAEWGIGGTVARWIREGKDVIYVVCSNGDKATMDPKIKAKDFAKIREQEQLISAKLLGVNVVVSLRHPDLGLEETPGLRKEILQLILRYCPNIVATCSPDQGYVSNPDHRITGRVTLDAIWPFALAPLSYPDLFQQDAELHKVKEVLLWQSKEPNYFSDISDTFETKMAACRCHKSQVGETMSLEDFNYMKERAIMAAQGQKFKLGEAFYRLEIPQRL